MSRFFLRLKTSFLHRFFAERGVVLNVLLIGLFLNLSTVLEASEDKTPGIVPAREILDHSFDENDAVAFQKPDAVFRPETWFHFIGGNVATQGITADLQAIAGAGIEGVQLFHGQFGGEWPGVTPQIKCLSEPWDGAVHHVAEECRRLGLRFTMQNCPGWAMSGGPWITPDKAMRHLVWSRMDIVGGSNVVVNLPRPQPSQEDWRDYRDVVVLAFPTPEGDTGKALIPVSIKSNRENLPWDKCLRNAANGTLVLNPESEPDWVEATFADTVTLRTIELPSVQGFNHQWCYVPGVTITVHAVLPDGMREVAHHEIPESNWQDNRPITLACAEVPSKTYRITIDHKHTMSLAYIQLFSGARLNNWESQAAFTLRALERGAYPHQSPKTWINPDRVMDLSKEVDAQGLLRWNAPAGQWTIVRWGHVNTGKRNGPAPPEGTGWECDKLSTVGAETHFAGYIGRLSRKGGPVGDGLMQGMLMDSWECETQTWTPGMEEQFDRLRGYALRKWFPALAGYVVGNPETTTRFLCDWRATINHLLVENFFGRMSSLGKKNGLGISYETAPGDVFPADILEYYKYADVPMCEFWQPRSEAFVGSFDFKPVKPCVSAAHMYGKPRVAAESFTSFNLTWNEHPGMLKNIVDTHFAEGVSHVVFHTYTHNPRTDWLSPGTAFGSGIGTPFLRGQTWWQNMGKFTAYLTRCSYLLERGRPVADVLWYLGDEINHKPPQNAPFPSGYHYDYCNPDVLLNRLSVHNGFLVTPEGIQYRILWMPDCQRMLPETLEKLVSFVKQGAIIVGKRPTGLATLCGGKNAEERFNKAVVTIWGKERDAGKVRRVGKGLVFSDIAIEKALVRIGLKPDVAGDGVQWTHRQSDGADWYFVAASARNGFKGTIRFRASGAVEFWNPLTGETRPAGVVLPEARSTLVSMDLPPSGSTFVVFRKGKKSPVNQVVRVEYGRKELENARVPHRQESGLKVISASYGDPSNSARQLDVTERVRRDLDHGAVTITVNNDWAGSDPALKTVKYLTAEVKSASGATKKLTAREGEVMPLVDTTPAPLQAAEVIDENKLLAWNSGAFRVFRKNGVVDVLKTQKPHTIELTGPWTLSFPAGWGAPDSLRINELKSWPDLDMSPEAKAFSGTVIYNTQFTLDSKNNDSQVCLDLGNVNVIALVKVNGKAAGTMWTTPYRLDVTRFVTPGVNELSISITSTWFNRLVYDAGRDEKSRKTWTISGPSKDAHYVPNGLLGPVQIHCGQVLDIR